jgi:hypothetical protein
MKKLLLGLSVGAILMFLLGFLLVKGIETAIDTHETWECYKWQQQAKEFELFYLTDWQQEQCDYHGIEIDY